MPLKSYRKRRAPLRRRPLRARRVYKRKTVSKPLNMATASETKTVSLITNTWTTFNDLALSQFPRASDISSSYQKYRINKVEFKLRPSFDTFGTVGGMQVPTLYKMLDKSATLPQTSGNLTLMKNLGAKPIRFDDKQISVSYKPTAMSEMQQVGSSAAAYMGRPIQSPWLSTNSLPDSGAVWSPSTVPHYGIAFYLDAYGLPNDIPIAIDITLHFEFKLPSFLVSH